MSLPLLSTKLNRPPTRSRLVQRPRLVEMLDQVITSRLILICAPAGFGKTTLMSIWAQQSGIPCAWLALDADDNNLKRFLTYAIHALREISPEVGKTSLALLQSSQAAAPDSVLTVLVSELSGIPHDFCLVLDDYHLIEAQDVHAALAFLVDYMPQTMHLALTSRSDPALPLSRLRARAQLLELRQADLRFTPEEAASFLNQNLGLSLLPQQAAALEARTEGWIAGLQLAALSMRGREDLEAFIGAFSGSHRFVIDYLADEVFSRQPEDQRQFLYRTAILERFTPALCNAVTGRDDAAALLRMLEESNLFLLPLDDQREWYRYHNLFQEFLQTRLPEHEKAELNRKASRWFSSQGLLAEAVRHALASGDPELAEEVIMLAALDVIKRADFQILLGWLDALPDQRVRANTALSIYKSYALFMTSSEFAAMPYAQAAEATLTDDASPSIRGQFLSLKAILLMCQNQLEECIHYAREAIESLDVDDQFFRSLTLNVLGQVMEMKGDVQSAADVYRQAFESGWKVGDHIGALVVFTNMVLSLNELGRLREADAWCRRVAEDVRTQVSENTPLLDAVYLPWSMLEYEADELERAGAHSKRSLEILQAAGFSPGILWALYIVALVRLAQGEIEAMRELTGQGRTLASQAGRESLQGYWFTALEAQASLVDGDLLAAFRWAESTGFTPHDRPQHWHDFPYFTYIRSLLAQEHFDEALELLDTMEALAEEGGRQRKLITIHLLQARALMAQGELEPAAEKASRALELAAAQGYLRAFLDEGQSILPLLQRVRQAAPGFVDSVLLAHQVPSSASSPSEEPAEALTEREQEVLDLVAKGLSNQQIAEALYVTVGTVKKHLNNIFSKLYVESRTQAIARGRELGILKQ